MRLLSVALLSALALAGCKEDTAAVVAPPSTAVQPDPPPAPPPPEVYPNNCTYGADIDRGVCNPPRNDQ